MKAPKSIPEVLYRYRSLKQAADMLKSQTMWATSPLDFSDLDDCFAYISDDESVEEKLAVINQLEMGTLPDFPQLSPGGAKRGRDCILATGKYLASDKIISGFAESLGGCGVVCFTEDPLNPQMWSFYGDHHKGVCFGFHTDAPSWIGQSEQVEYQLAAEYEEITIGKLLTAPEISIRKVVKTKSKRWEFEEEWRLFRSGDPGSNSGLDRICKFSLEWIKEVVFGSKVTPEEAQSIQNLLRDFPGIEYSIVNRQKFGQLSRKELVPRQ